MGDRRSFWERTKSGSKAGFDKAWKAADKLGAPVNRLSNRLGAEAFWPTTLDKESDKAARILRSFVKDGFYEDQERRTVDGPKQKQRVIMKIPPSVIRKAKGLAIFTTMRSGLWISGAGGSGVLVARMEDGTWSPPCGILLHTAGLGFLVGVDIYDCVLVLNTVEAVSAFSKWRATIGGELSAVAGPVGIGGIVDTSVNKPAPIFTYMRSRGFYAGIQVDGTVVVERTDENERFYGTKIKAADILAGKTQPRTYELRMLMETLKAAQGDKVDEALLPSEPPPAEHEIVTDGQLFGIPARDDPDPFGILALEEQGLVIREAGTKRQATVDEFEFNPKSSSPVHGVFRRSFDGSQFSPSPRESWRQSSAGSVNNQRSGARYSTMSDAMTQTDEDVPSSLNKAAHEEDGKEILESPEDRTVEEGNALVHSPSSLHEDYYGTKPGLSVSGVQGIEHSKEADFEDVELSETPIEMEENDREKDGHIAKEIDRTLTKDALHNDPDDMRGPDDDEEDDAVEIHEVHQAPAQVVTMRPRMVNVPKLIPPKLPPRNPTRVATAAGTQVTATELAEREATPQPTEPEPTTVDPTSSPEKESSQRGSSWDEHEQEKESMTTPSSSPRRSPSYQSVQSALSARDAPATDPATGSPSKSEETLEPPSRVEHPGVGMEHEYGQEHTAVAEPPSPPRRLSDDIPGSFPDISPVDEDDRHDVDLGRPLTPPDPIETEKKTPKVQPTMPKISMASIRQSLDDEDDDISPVDSRHSSFH